MFKRTFGLLLFEKSARALSALITFVALTRSVSPSEVGFYVVGAAISSLCILLSAGGYHEIFMREMARNKSKFFYFQCASILLISGWVIYATSGVLLFLAISNTSILWVVLILNVSMLTQFNDAYESRRLSLGMHHEVLPFRIFLILVFSAAKVFITYKFQSIYWLAAIVLVESLAQQGYYFYLTLKDFAKFKIILDWRIFGLVSQREVFYMVLFSASSLLNMRVDHFFIAHYEGPEGVAVFNVAVKFFEIFILLLASLTTALYSKFLSLDVSIHVQERRWIDYFKVSVLSAVVFMLLVTLFMKPIVVTLFDEVYLSAVPILLIYMLSSVPVAIGFISTKYFIYNKIAHMNVLRVLSGLFLNLLLNFILVPRFGTNGAAWSTVVSSIFAAFILDYFVCEGQSIRKLKRRAFWLPF